MNDDIPGGRPPEWLDKVAWAAAVLLLIVAITVWGPGWAR